MLDIQRKLIAVWQWFGSLAVANPYLVQAVPYDSVVLAFKVNVKASSIHTVKASSSVGA
jgi:hypothetical protein